MFLTAYYFFNNFAKLKLYNIKTDLLRYLIFLRTYQYVFTLEIFTSSGSHSNYA